VQRLRGEIEPAGRHALQPGHARLHCEGATGTIHASDLKSLFLLRYHFFNQLNNGARVPGNLLIVYTFQSSSRSRGGGKLVD
jgi:hypothetical protein